MAKRSIKKGMRRMGMDNVREFRGAQANKIIAMARGGVKLIEGDDKVREEKCLAKFRQDLEVFKCAAIPMVTMGAGRIEAWVRFIGPDKGTEEACLAAIKAGLDMFDCDMIPEVTVGGGQIKNNVRIQAKPRQVLKADG